MAIIGAGPFIGLDFSACANVSAWMGRCTTRPAFGRVMQEG
jgi:hypothetical protein